MAVNAAVTLSYARALRSGGLSLTMPIMALSPVLPLLAAPLMTGVSIPLLGAPDAVIMTAGAVLILMSP